MEPSVQQRSATTVRKTILSAAIVALIAGFAVRPSTAAAEDNIPHRIGLIDMADIFKKYTKFRDQRAKIQDQLIESDKESKLLMTKIQSLQDRIKKFVDDSPERNRLQNELVDTHARYKAYRQKQKIEFIGKESKLYKDIYLEVATAVRQYAEFYKYTLILRYNRHGVEDAKDPQAIISKMNRIVVYVKPGEDITQPVLDYLNKKYDPTGTIEARLKRREEGELNTARRPGANSSRRASVELTEHVLAAFYGLRVDNCLIQINGPESPGCDGSSQQFVDSLIDAEIVEQSAERQSMSIVAEIHIEGTGSDIGVQPLNRDVLSIGYELDYGDHSPIPLQRFNLEMTPEAFVSEIAFARTFVLESEVRALRSAGFGMRVTEKDLLVFQEDGNVLGNRLRAPDECARHKILDCLGDFALIGCDLYGHFNAYRSGHQLNRDVVRSGQQRYSTESGMSRLKTAVIGVGALGKHHARILSEHSDVELTAVVDTNAEMANTVAANCGCDALGDFRELFDRVDAVSIVVPTSAHLPVAREFLERGIPVLVEKPLAINVDQCRQLVELADAHETILQVGHIERFNPATEAAWALTGPPKYIRAERLSPYAFRSTDIGAVLDLMIHDIDLVLDLVRSPVAQVDAFGLCILGGHEDSVQARLTFENGCIADLTANRVHPTARRFMQILSLEGNVTVDFHSRDVTGYSPSDRLRYGPSPLELAARPGADITELKEQVFGSFLAVDRPAVPKTDALTAELDDFITSVRTGKSPRVDGQAGLRALEVAEAILERVAGHQWDGHTAGRIGPDPESGTPLRAVA
eukprot:g8382.t1